MPHVDHIVDGDIWPSATNLTHLLPQDFLWSWYKREVQKHGWRGWQKCNATSNRGKRLGTHVHGLVEMALTGKKYVAWLDEEKQLREPNRRLKQLEAWAKAIVETTQKDTINTIETKIISKSRHEHGTCDATVIDDILGLKIIDWKTSGSMDISFPIQLAIYARCWNEQEPDKLIDVGEIQRIDKKSKKFNVQVKTYQNLSQYYPVIDALHTIWDYVHKQGIWKKEKESAEA